jgi:ParB/RepB/Spo0J family partition protein
MDAIGVNNKSSEKNEMPGHSAAAIDRRPEVHDIPVEKIKPSEFWIRSDWEEGLDSLAESIDLNGLQQFPAVRDNGDASYTLIFGHRRYLSYKQLGRKTVPCYVIDTTAEDAAFLLLIENLQRRQLHPVDEARTIKRVADKLGVKDIEIARRISWKPSVVSERLAVLKLPEHMLAKVGTSPNSRLTFTHLLTLSWLWDPNRSDRQFQVSGLYNKTIQYEVSTTELKDLVALFKEGKSNLLPKNLRARLLGSKSMTAAMARLYLIPESAVTGDDDKAKRMREVAQGLSKKELERLIVTAVDAEWPYERARRKLLDMVESRLQTGEKRVASSQSGVQRLVLKISELRKKLHDTREEIEDIAKSNPKQLGTLWEAIGQLHKRLDPIEALVANEFLGKAHKQQSPIKEPQDVVAG